MMMRKAERSALGRQNYDLFLGDPEEEFTERLNDGASIPDESDLGKLFDDLNRKYFDCLVKDPSAWRPSPGGVRRWSETSTREIPTDLPLQLHRCRAVWVHLRLPT